MPLPTMYVYASDLRPFRYPLGIYQNPHRRKNGAKPIINPSVSNKYTYFTTFDFSFRHQHESKWSYDALEF